MVVKGNPRLFDPEKASGNGSCRRGSIRKDADRYRVEVGPGQGGFSGPWAHLGGQDGLFGRRQNALL